MRISDWSSDVCSSDLADRIEQFFRNARRDVAARMFGFGRRIETRPAPGEPVGLVRLVGLRRLEIAFEPRGEFGAARVGTAGVDHPFILQLPRAKLRHRPMLPAAVFHPVLCERRHVAYVLAEIGQSTWQ